MTARGAPGIVPFSRGDGRHSTMKTIGTAASGARLSSPHSVSPEQPGRPSPSHRKPCSGCGETKDYSEFYRRRTCSDGRYSLCKECQTAQNNAYYSANRAKVLKQQRDYAKRHPGKARGSARRYSNRNPEKRRAGRIVRSALRSGSLEKAGVCAGCGKSLWLHAHHEDYSRPVDVIWLCTRCHGKRHRKYA